MSKKLVLALGLGLVGLAGCTQNINPTDMDRGLIGAGVGATAAYVGGHNVAKGAAIGAVGGALCDDVRLSNGQWHVSFVTAPPKKIVSGSGRTVGIDRGVTVTLATSDGEMLRKPTLTKVQQDRFLRLQRAKSRTQKGSKNRARILDRMARLRARQGNLDAEFVEQTTTRLAKTYDLVVLEALKTAQMSKRPEPKPDPDAPGEYLPNGAAAKAALNRLILASQWGRIQTRLQAKTTVTLIDPRNTSRRCSLCGHVARENRESQADFRCVECGYEDNADLNAAKNILAAGLRDTEPEDFGGSRATAVRGHEPTGREVPTMMVLEPHAAGIPGFSRGEEVKL